MGEWHPRTWWNEEGQHTSRTIEEARQLEPRPRDRQQEVPVVSAEALPAGRECTLRNNTARKWMSPGYRKLRSPGGGASHTGSSYATWMLPVALCTFLHLLMVDSFHNPLHTFIPGVSIPSSLISPLHRRYANPPHLARKPTQREHATRSLRTSSSQLSRLQCIFRDRILASSDAALHTMPTLEHPSFPSYLGAAAGSLIWSHHSASKGRQRVRCGLGLRGESGDWDEEKMMEKVVIPGMDVDEFVDKEFLSYDASLEQELSVVVSEEDGVALELTDVDDAVDEEFLGEPRSGDETDDWLVYTWDGDLIRAEAFSDSYRGPSRESFSISTAEAYSDFLADGEYTVYTEDGDELLVQMSWDVFDRWDTYDSTLVDPQSAEFAQLVNFRVPARFNWNATTSDNYRAHPEEAGKFYGTFSKTRAELDYSYHVHYERNRQELQDEIIKFWVSHGKQAKRPWIVFTAGAMGAGKSHSIKRLQARGLQALDDMVKVDPDTVKYQLPEMQEYISRNPGPNPSNKLILAGLATHNESAFLQELIVSELLERSKHLIVDGSLSNADWFASYFAYIRRRYPHYRIGIVHVVCDPEVIWDRVVDRCRRTGRCISKPVVDLSVKVVDSGKGDEDDEKVHITHLSEDLAEVAARKWMDDAADAGAMEASWLEDDAEEVLEMLKGQRAVELLEIALGQDPGP